MYTIKVKDVIAHLDNVIKIFPKNKPSAPVPSIYKVTIDVRDEKNVHCEFLTIFTTLLKWFYIDYNQANLSSAELQHKCLTSCKKNYDDTYTFVVLYKQGSDLHPTQRELSVTIPDLCFVEYLLGKEAAIALPYIEEPGYPVMLNFEL